MSATLAAGLLALAAHIGQEDTLAADLQALPFFRHFERGAGAMRAKGWLSQMQECRASLLACPATAPVKFMLAFAQLAVDSGLRGMAAGIGCPESLNPDLHLRETGRLVVKNAFPCVLSAYACGAYGDFSVHRLPLQAYPPNYLPALEQVQVQTDLGQALRATRKHKCIVTRQQVQANPSTAIRSQQTGKPLAKWSTTHWQSITWRLGYTTVFDLLALAAEQAAETPAPAGLHDALLRIASYCQQVFSAYLIPSYQVVGEAFVLPTSLAA
jgi:hypothetical protein